MLISREKATQVWNQTKDVLAQARAFIIDLPEWYKRKSSDLSYYLEHTLRSMQNLRQTNFDLGIYHLKIGNINDAIMRFQFVTKILNKGDKSGNYWLGWCYFLKGNYEKAIEALARAESEDKLHLKEFIENSNSASSIPEDILLQYRELATSKEITKWSKLETYLPNEFVTQLFDAVQELPKECKILDLGCSIGFIGVEIDDRLQKNYHLAGTEDVDALLDGAKYLREDKTKVYDSLIKTSIRDFLSNNKDKYNVITSLCSLTFSRDLRTYLSQIERSLKADGYFAFLVGASNTTEWSRQRCEFTYSTEDMKSQLGQAKLEIVYIKEFMLSKSNVYTMFVCTKYPS